MSSTAVPADSRSRAEPPLEDRTRIHHHSLDILRYLLLRFEYSGVPWPLPSIHNNHKSASSLSFRFRVVRGYEVIMMRSGNKPNGEGLTLNVGQRQKLVHYVEERANEAIRFYQQLFGTVNQEVQPNRALIELLLNTKLTLEDGNSLYGTVLAMEVKEEFAVDPSKAPVPDGWTDSPFRRETEVQARDILHCFIFDDTDFTFRNLSKNHLDGLFSAEFVYLEECIALQGMLERAKLGHGFTEGELLLNKSNIDHGGKRE
ncbi:unnamed protein product [Linum tenue]|uniref:Uncharacterized protein n=1 Tax=Linum tenue TaxID=586396 RepID=A0AAV0NJT9_9ROSI|nr:unnamed protein product [Linum tenue]